MVVRDSKFKTNCWFLKPFFGLDFRGAASGLTGPITGLVQTPNLQSADLQANDSFSLLNFTNTMKKLIAIATLIVAAASLNVGCTASAGIKPNSSATKLNTTTQVAYVSAPVRK